MKIRMIALVLATVFGSELLSSQSIADSFEVSGSPFALLPLAQSADLYTLSWGGRAVGWYKDLPFLRPLIDYQFLEAQVQDKTALSVRSFGAGAEYLSMLDTHWGWSASAEGGLYQATRQGLAVSSWWGGAQASALYRITPWLSLSLDTGYSSYDGGIAPLLQGLQAGLSVRMSFSSGSGSVRAELASIDPVFPILHTWYGDNAYAQVSVSNLEDGAIENLQVGLLIPQYMDQAQFSVPYPGLSKGQSVSIALKSLFNEAVFKLTEDTKVAGDLMVSYVFLGERREKHFSVTVPVLNRNALSWKDDRRAAAFVGPRDPAVLRFTKYAAGLIRDAGNQGLGADLSFAVGLWEGFKSLGIRYVIDPTSPYTELSSADAVDYLQYPFQTIQYRGGDCDDLSILYASMLESIGIPAAFITVPGHIYAAVGLNLTDAQAQETFVNGQDLIVSDGKVWLPVEITLTQQPFLKAWQVGASQWRQFQATGQAQLIPIRNAWSTYPPVGIPGEEGRFVLPDASPLLTAWGQSMAELSKRELEPKVSKLRADLASGGDRIVVGNKLGLLYARFGMNREAEVEFQAAIKSGSTAALVNLGKIYLMTNRAKLAKEVLLRAVAARPGDANAQLGLNRALTELGESPTTGGKR